jgi:hypothetical protein
MVFIMWSGGGSSGLLGLDTSPAPPPRRPSKYFPKEAETLTEGWMYRVIWNAVRFQQESLLHGPGKRVGIETSIRLLARADDDSQMLDSFYLIQKMVWHDHFMSRQWMQNDSLVYSTERWTGRQSLPPGFEPKYKWRSYKLAAATEMQRRSCKKTDRQLMWFPCSRQESH